MDLPGETQLRWTIGRMARLLEIGAEPVRGLVQPDGNFFPDTFDGSPESIGALFARIMDHAGLGDVKTQLGVVTPEGKAVSCSSGGCGGGAPEIDVRLSRVKRAADGGYAVLVPAAELAHPVVLTTGLVRAMATVFLFEADGYAVFEPRDAEPVTDLAAVMLGFGVLVANGAHLFMKGCGGSKVHKATQLPLGEVVIALAAFCSLYEVDGRTARRCLDPTQREAFDESAAWARSNASVVKQIRTNRHAIEAEAYRLAPARGWLARTFGIGVKRRPDAGEDLDDLERALAEAPAPRSAKSGAMDAAKRKKLDELRALVDESLAQR